MFSLSLKSVSSLTYEQVEKSMLEQAMVLAEEALSDPSYDEALADVTEIRSVFVGRSAEDC